MLMVTIPEITSCPAIEELKAWADTLVQITLEVPIIHLEAVAAALRANTMLYLHSETPAGTVQAAAATLRPAAKLTQLKAAALCAKDKTINPETKEPTNRILAAPHPQLSVFPSPNNLEKASGNLQSSKRTQSPMEKSDTKSPRLG